MWHRRVETTSKSSAAAAAAAAAASSGVGTRASDWATGSALELSTTVTVASWTTPRGLSQLHGLLAAAVVVVVVAPAPSASAVSSRLND